MMHGVVTGEPMRQNIYRSGIGYAVLVSLILNRLLFYQSVQVTDLHGGDYPCYKAFSSHIGHFRRLQSRIRNEMRRFIGHNVLVVCETWCRIILWGKVKYNHDYLLRLLQFPPRGYFQ